MVKATFLILAMSLGNDGCALTSFTPPPMTEHHRRRSHRKSSEDGESSPSRVPPPTPPPPPTTTRTTSTTTTITDPHTILGLSRLSPPTDFADVQRAYRDMARRFHPDAIVGPDASYEERDKANAIFARINGAYEELKVAMRGGGDDDDDGDALFEVVIMGGNFEMGKRDRRVKYRARGGTTARNGPDGVNYDRILELRKRSNLKGRNWSDPGEFEYPSGGRHNGDFGPPRRW
ncbi:hypothetical protein ACHAXA_003964 [Cyclostephanos tholiformis]|uniref:J domain-containing protein n=1 Tax=Cyclostephanos tholiformis TaxID=382380 RepID=A0ABD3RIY9_9STRA